MHCFIFILIASWRDFFFGMDCAVSKGEKVFRNAGKTVLRAAWETDSQDVPHSVNIISPHDIRGAAEKSLSATAPAPRVSTFVVCVRNTQSLALCVNDSTIFLPVEYKFLGQLTRVPRPLIPPRK